MSNESKDNFIKEIYKDGMSKKIFRAILFMVLIAGIFAVIRHFYKSAKGEHSKIFWGFDENNIPKGYPDTVYVQKNTDKPKVQIADKVENKGKNSFNGNVSGGAIQVGDNNTQNNSTIKVVKEKELTNELSAKILSEINKTIELNKLRTKCVYFDVIPGANGPKIISQLKDFLTSKGFDLRQDNIIGPVYKGYKVFEFDGCVAIELGTL
jgi:predicted house-cleaning noncanonical NTP pyrophosphatase (MazG superfamily)